MLILLVTAAACGPAPSAPTPDLVSTVVSGTLTAVASHPAPGTSTPTATAAPSPTSGPFTGPVVVTSAQNVNLRTRPGLLFPVSRVMAQGTELQILGRAPGGDWLNVLTRESIVGWVQVNLVEGGHDGPPPPIVEPSDVLVVMGRVTDPSGRPVSGIGFAVTQGTAANAPRTDATTDDTGTFYAFLPRTASGTWIVGYTSIACTSNLMDAECNCPGGACGEPNPASLPVVLPVTETLLFIWE
jgi:hypothetical protein